METIGLIFLALMFLTLLVLAVLLGVVITILNTFKRAITMFMRFFNVL